MRVLRKDLVSGVDLRDSWAASRAEKDLASTVAVRLWEARVERRDQSTMLEKGTY